MKNRQQLFRWMGGGCLALSGSIAAGCSGEIPPGPQTYSTASTGAMGTTGGMAATTTAGAGAATTTGGAATTTGVGGDFPQPTACVGEQIGGSKRMVRLTFHQLANSIGGLLGDVFAQSLVDQFDIGDPMTRTFPPLANLNEGAVVTDIQWQKTDSIAEFAAQHVVDNYAAVTGCTDPADDACAQAFLEDFAARAYRRPPDSRELARVLQVYTEVTSRSGPQAGVQFGVYAVLQSPQFLYRTEFGDASNVAGSLTAHELASQLAFFITDGGPDQQLRDAATNGQLSTRDGIEAQASRLLQLETAKVNLQAAMLAYFGLPGMFSVIIDPAVAPDFNPGLANAMFRESELFLNYTLWNGVLDDIMTSTQSFVNADLATLYGISIPPTAVPDADGFAAVQLPETRSGLLTQAGFLTARSRPNTPSVVGRGLLVNATLLCAQNPPFPEELIAAVEEAELALEGSSEREKADYRAETVPCNGCHVAFDPYGLALENFDIIGKYRTEDNAGRSIDASVTLPPGAGGAMVADAVGMADQLAVTGGFARCLARNLLGYALAEGAVAIDSCSVQAVVDEFNQTDKSFTSLVREVAISQTLIQRAAGSAGGMQ